MKRKHERTGAEIVIRRFYFQWMDDLNPAGGPMPTGNADHMAKWRYGRPEGNTAAPVPVRRKIPRGLVLAKERCRAILEDPAYEKQLRDRALAGDLPPALEIMLHHYAYGKPIEKIEVLDENAADDYSGLTVEQLRARVETLRIAAASANPDGLKVIDVTPIRTDPAQSGVSIQPIQAIHLPDEDDPDFDPSIYDPVFPDDPPSGTDTGGSLDPTSGPDAPRMEPDPTSGPDGFAATE